MSYPFVSYITHCYNFSSMLSSGSLAVVTLIVWVCDPVGIKSVYEERYEINSFAVSYFWVTVLIPYIENNVLYLQNFVCIFVKKIKCPYINLIY